MRNESEKVGSNRCTIDRARLLLSRREYEHTCWDPKDGELCLNRVKPEETLVEARRDSDEMVFIDPS